MGEESAIGAYVQAAEELRALLTEMPDIDEDAFKQMHGRLIDRLDRLWEGMSPEQQEIAQTILGRP